MNKKIIGLGVATLSLGILLVAPSVDAFGGRGAENNPERYAEMQEMRASFDSVEDFRGARDEMRANRESLVSHDVEKIANGVVFTITTDDADALARMQERQANGENGNGEGFNRENVSRSVETLENGTRITITTDDADTLERLHDRADNGWKRGQRRNGRGGSNMNGQGGGQGGRGGQGGGQRGGMRK